ncbi:MAG: efflux RND transporter periplasmic adaptor subunit [Deltaproteobacteria bacterium]
MIASTRTRAALLAGAVTVAVAGCGPRDGGHPAPDQAPPGTVTTAQRARLELAPVEARSFRPATEVTGTVAFNGDISTQVLAPISGPVARILVEPGARVRRGQALAVVASPDYAAAVATYRKAEATAANLQRIADLDAQLFQNDGLARRDLEQAQTDAATAAADQEAALEQLRALGVDSVGIEAIKGHRPAAGPQGVVRAPIAGRVVERLITPGQLLQAGATPCFTIADLSSVWVMAHVFEAQLPDVAEGDSAAVTLTDDTSRVYRGRVTYVGALVNPDTRATDVRVLTQNPREGLKRDMFVRVTIRSRRERTGLLVPASAVLRDAQNLPFVFAAAPGGRFVRRPVQLGGHVGPDVEVAGGVAAGDTVITQGGLFLQFAESQ